MQSNTTPKMIGRIVKWVTDKEFLLLVGTKLILCHKDYWHEVKRR